MIDCGTKTIKTKQHLVRVIRQNRYSHEICIPMDLIRKMKLKAHDILECSLKGNKIIYEKVDIEE